MSERKKQAQQRREQFLQIALELFATRGFDKTSIRDLALQAHVTEGLLYHYFRSKEELLIAVIEQESFLPQLRQLFTEPSPGSVQQVLVEFAHSFSHLLVQKRYLMRIILREAQTNSIIARWFHMFMEQGITIMAQFLQSRIDIGELRPHQTEVMARSIFYTLVMHQMLETAHSKFIHEYIENLLQGLLMR